MNYEDNKPRNSSGVDFTPHHKYWQIDGKFYDLTNFLDKHPGGKQILLLCKNRFEDHTYAIEAHHTNFKLIRKMLAKYEIKDETPNLFKTDNMGIKHYYPKFCDDNSFYSVLRTKVNSYLNNNGGPGPSLLCLNVFFVIFLFFCLFYFMTAYLGKWYFALILGFFSSLLGGYGHNWVHQPNKKLFAYLSLNLSGFSCEVWFREHLLQHHMYTNTPQDNHFYGTEPFIVTDPTKKRSFLQNLSPLILCLVLIPGTLVNYITTWLMIIFKKEDFYFSNLIFLVEMMTIIYSNGLKEGLILIIIWTGSQSIWYFNIALWNHNTEHTLNLKNRNESKDFGEFQLNTSSDIGTDLTFLQSWKYLWLNFHTVHHLFPHIDFSHHPNIQKIIIETAREFNIKYHHIDSFFQSYLEMIWNMRNNKYSSNEIINFYLENFK